MIEYLLLVRGCKLLCQDWLIDWLVQSQRPHTRTAQTQRTEVVVSKISINYIMFLYLYKLIAILSTVSTFTVLVWLSERQSAYKNDP